jgi:HSP20 family molecular chaperone IbpA
MTAITAPRMPVLMSAWLNALNPFGNMTRQPSVTPEPVAWFPVAISETGSHIRFEVELDGLNCVDTQVFIHRGELSIQITCEVDAHDAHLVHYCREFPLPLSVRNAHASIGLQGMVFAVNLPKS